VAEKRILLSIDGGGLRGILPVCMLARLEEQTGKRALDVFSFAAGTSTGAVIAGGIAAGIPAMQMLNLYLHRAGDVFPRHRLDPAWKWARRFTKGHFYSSNPLRRVLGEEAGAAMDWNLNDSPIDIMITGKRVDDGMPWYFVKDNPKNRGRTGKLSLVDCVTASCVVPTFHEPWTVPEPDPPAGHRPVGRLVDGGVGVAGNPVYQACVEAFSYSEGYSPSDTVIVSLGTGHHTSLANPTWILKWLTWTLGELLDSAGEQQTALVERHFAQTPFYRLQPVLPRSIGGDSVESVPELYEIGQRFAAQIDWEPILAGEDSPFRISESNTLARQYSKPVQPGSPAPVS
jgi:predicted acylesterase/phospholipase RssA